MFSQLEDAWIFFKDKPELNTYLSNPISMLSQRSIDRRNRLKIPFDTKDAPIHSSYYNQIKNASGISVMAKSKWLNAVHVRGEKAVIDNLVTAFNFIKAIEFANKSYRSTINPSENARKNNHLNKLDVLKTDFNYGVTNTQVTMIKANYLHQQGFTGKGMHIAVFDAGFPNVQSLDAFKRLRTHNKLLGGYNFVTRKANFYNGHSHGTHVLSDIAGYIENKFVGTAPDASFYLFITEDVNNETPLEESLWVEAAERADSLGVDIINTSLGYTTFDNPKYNYTYDDMNGSTTFISRGAEIGASRGMMLVASAGNSGRKPWKYISAPADAASVLAIGAVDAQGSIASFSSFGPTSDNRVKPDILAHGQNVYMINYNSDAPSLGSGTSLASPLIAGAIACLWQAFPNVSQVEMLQKIRESADKYENPTHQFGYGIPNFEKIFKSLSIKNIPNNNEVSCYPNPVKKILFINTKFNNATVSVINLLGLVIKEEQYTSNGINVSDLPTGMFILKIEKEGFSHKIKFVKK